MAVVSHNSLYTSSNRNDNPVAFYGYRMKFIYISMDGNDFLVLKIRIARNITERGPVTSHWHFDKGLYFPPVGRERL